jgi:hypothetical protein
MAAMSHRIVRVSRLGRIAVAICLLLGAAGRSEAEAPSPADVARWVSSDAVIYLEALKPAAFVDRVLDDRVQAPLRAVPPLRAALEREEVGKLKDVAQQVAAKLGTTWQKALRDLTGGGAVFAAEAEEGQPPRFFLIVTPTDADLLKRANTALLEMARKDAADKGKPDPVKQVEYRGQTGYAVGPKVVYGIVNDRLIIADRSETGKAVVDRILDGPASKASVADQSDWKARRAAVAPDAIAWGMARMDRLRKLDPKRYGSEAKPDTGQTIFFGGWIDTLRKAPWLAASLTWTDSRLTADVTAPVPAGGRTEAYDGYVPPKGAGAPALVKVRGVIASLSLYRDLATVWEARADLLPPEAVQNLAKLDTFAGQFFGGRDFGTGVLGALASDWRLVAALQDYSAMKPVPDVKLPAFALVMDLKPDDDFAERLKVAFQSFIGLANLGAAESKSKAPPLELGSETFEGVTIATSQFMKPPPPKPADDAGARAKRSVVSSPPEPVHYRHNFSPCAVQVGSYFVISSSLGLTRDLVKALKSPAKAEDATLVTEADGAVLSKLVYLNRSRMVMQNMLDRGHDKEQAEAEVRLISALLDYLGHGRLSIQDGADATRVELDFALGK